MESFYINGGNRLEGELSIYSAKNACLPILAAALVHDGKIVVKNISLFSDVKFMIEILETLGAKSEIIGNDLYLDLSLVDKYTVSQEHTKKVRSSIFLLGSLLSRFKQAVVSYPGGCNIGTRPIDIHLKGLTDLGVKIVEEDGNIICDGQDMKAADLHFSFPSVGATENIMMASIFLKGTTRIFNAAKEPEIEDLQNFLNALGAKVRGAGSSVITITGVESTKDIEYKPIPDRIVTGTYLIACAVAGGKITLNNVVANHNAAIIKELKRAGFKLKVKSEEITITANNRPKSIKNISTKPYPGFPTDLQSQFLTMLALADGVSTVTENLYETRFKITPHLVNMGANISVRGRDATIYGVDELIGKEVSAPDLRSGAGLVIAGLKAKGITKITDIDNIDRGYLNLDKDLQSLGADIRRINF